MSLKRPLFAIAATGDKEATKAQFGNLTRNCKSDRNTQHNLVYR